MSKPRFFKLVSGVIGLAVAFGIALPAKAQSVSDLTAQINSLLSTIASLQGQLNSMQGGSAGAACAVTFSRNLSMGMSGADVKELQKVLNRDSQTKVAVTGAGSVGNETMFFGPATKAAVIKFQNKYAAEVLTPAGLTQGSGFVGAFTRAKLNALCTAPVTPVNPGPVPTSTPAGSAVLKVRAASTANGQFAIVPFNASAASFGKFEVTATNKDVEITGLNLAHTGLGNPDAIDNVWVTINGVQHGSEKTFSGNTATFTFPNDSIMVKAGQTVILEIMASMRGNTADSGQYHSLGISAIQTTAVLDASLPVYGPLTSVSSQGAAVVTMTTQGSNKTINVGSVNTEIGKFQLNADSDSDRDVTLNSITLENKGTANNLGQKLKNVVLTVAGKTVSSSVVINDNTDSITILFNNYILKDGQTVSMTLQADIISAEVGDTIQLQLNNDKDLFAYETGSNYGVRVNGDDGVVTTPANNVDLKTYTLQTGDVNLSVNDSAARTVAPGQTRVTLLNGNLKIDSGIRADGLLARLYTGTDTDNDTLADLNADFSNVTLVVDGATIDNVDTLTNADAAGTAFVKTGNSTADYYDFSSTFELTAGTHNIKVLADVKNNATVNDKVQLIILTSDLDSPEYLSSHDSVPSSRLTGQVTGAVVTIEQATLTASRNDGFSGEQFVGGAKGVTLMKFTLDNNDAADVFVSSLTVAKTAGSYPLGDVTNLRLFVDGVQKGSSVDLNTGSFTDVNFNIARSQQAQLELRGDTNTATTTGQTLTVAVTDVDATDDQGNSATVKVGGSAISTGNPLSSDALTINTGGTVNLAIDGNTPDEAIIVARNGIWYPVASYRFDAQDDQVRVTDLFLMNATSVANVLASSSFADSRVQTLGLFDENDNLIMSKTLTNGAVHFDLGSDASSSINIAADDFSKVTVKVKLNTIDDATKTGRLLRLVVDTTQADGDGFIAQSVSTGADLASTSVSITSASSTASDFFAIRRSKPTLTTVARTDSSQLQNGSNQAVFRFKVAADQNRQIAWKGIKFDVRGTFGGANLSASTSLGLATSTGGTAVISNAELFEVGSGQEVQNGSYSVAYEFDSTNSNGEVAVILNDNTEEVVSAGSSKTYELRVTISGATNGGDSLSVSLDNEADDAATAAYLVTSDPEEVDGNGTAGIQMTKTAATNPYSFLWSDYSGAPHSAANDNATLVSRDWTNDRFVDIDTSSWTISRNN